MSLVKKYEELNKLSEECVKKIMSINQEYLKSDSMDYPYDVVDNMLNNYNSLYNKVIRKKNSFINILLCKFSSKKEELLHSMLVYDKYEIFNVASEKTVPYILEYFEEHKLVEEDLEDISAKVFPTIRGFYLKSLVNLYRECKKCDRILHNGNALAYLQEIFVEYIISNILSEQKRKGVKSGVIWSYKEICYKILDESVLKFRKVERIENKRYPD